MQGPRRDEGPDFGPVGFTKGLRAPAPVRRERRGQRLAIAQNSLAGVEGFQLSAQEMRSLNQLEDRLASPRGPTAGTDQVEGPDQDRRPRINVEGPDWDPTTHAHSVCVN